jgi:hypothetical protein
MNKFAIVGALVVAATGTALAPGHGNSVSPSRGYDRSFGVGVILVNAPGGDSIQCDPKVKSSPIRCKPDGW